MREGYAQGCRQAGPLHKPRHSSSWRTGPLKFISHIKGIAENWRAQTGFLCPSGKNVRTLISICHRGTVESNLLAPPPQQQGLREPGIPEELLERQGSLSPLLSQSPEGN